MKTKETGEAELPFRITPRATGGGACRRPYFPSPGGAVQFRRALPKAASSGLLLSDRANQSPGVPG